MNESIYPPHRNVPPSWISTRLFFFTVYDSVRSPHAFFVSGEGLFGKPNGFCTQKSIVPWTRDELHRWRPFDFSAAEWLCNNFLYYYLHAFLWQKNQRVRSTLFWRQFQWGCHTMLIASFEGQRFTIGFLWHWLLKEDSKVWQPNTLIWIQEAATLCSCLPHASVSP
jgi:hypothetical protein